MKDSTRRSIRTGFDVALGVLATLLAVVPLLTLIGVDADSVGVIAASIAGCTAAISKLRNELEDAGVIRKRLK